MVGGVGFTVIVNVKGVPLQPAPLIKPDPNEMGLEPTLIVFVTVLVAVLITETLFEPAFTTYTWLPSGLTDIPPRPVPAAMVAITVLVVVLITETLFELLFATYIRLPSGVTEMP